jgi:hypothetical protein
MTGAVVYGIDDSTGATSTARVAHVLAEHLGCRSYSSTLCSQELAKKRLPLPKDGCEKLSTGSRRMLRGRRPLQLSSSHPQNPIDKSVKVASRASPAASSASTSARRRRRGSEARRRRSRHERPGEDRRDQSPSQAGARLTLVSVARGRENPQPVSSEDASGVPLEVSR